MKVDKEPPIPPALIYCRLFAKPLPKNLDNLERGGYEKCRVCLDHQECIERIEWEAHRDGYCHIAWCKICRKAKGYPIFKRKKL